MSFTFNFNFSEESSSNQENINTNSLNLVLWYSKLNEISNSFDSEINIIQERDAVIGKQCIFDEIQVESVHLFKFREDNTSQMFDLNSDLIPGVYEGGFKVWECTIDLIKLICHNPGLQRRLQDAKVLDLGCGHGFLGIVSLLYGASWVAFSDFNAEVLRSSTIYNIQKNCGDLRKSSLFPGDWLQLHAFLAKRDEVFSIILTAETIYNKDCCEKVLFMIQNHLEVNGVALVATKRFYFGVGGGSSMLEDLSRDLPDLQIELLSTYEDGSSNIRDIYQITKISRS